MVTTLPGKYQVRSVPTSQPDPQARQEPLPHHSCPSSPKGVSSMDPNTARASEHTRLLPASHAVPIATHPHQGSRLPRCDDGEAVQTAAQAAQPHALPPCSAVGRPRDFQDQQTARVECAFLWQLPSRTRAATTSLPRRRCPGPVGPGGPGSLQAASAQPHQAGCPRKAEGAGGTPSLPVTSAPC